MIHLNSRSDSSHSRVIHDFLFEVNRLNSRLLAEEDRLVQAFGLTSARWKVLSILAIAELPLTVPQISRRLSLSRQNIQRLVDVMANEGIVEYRTNPDHKRAKLVSFTKKGEQQCSAILQEYIPWTQRCVHKIKPVDLEKTLEVIKVLIGQLDQE